MATETREHSLDELAKELATGTLSRGKAIRWMGGALLGAALASVPGLAWANDCRRLAGNVGGTPSAARGTASGVETTKFVAARKARLAATTGA
jgi:hypothetical protein